ncbi:FG-GAP-like repeat-containing protein [Pseudoxanthomonas dokdonensis]|uniref:FG-GAP-like repeat-containing protein n=1 Tax=Pseudoxanthomonas dokdonensis TaxID=344882 RepID=UPI00071106C5|nr:FG-GAP-like repeat-containing protein [Pseudoxanthomonas dokdonensis]
MKYRLGACAAMLLLAACQNGGVDGEAKVAKNASHAGPLPTLATAGPLARASIASAPDRGALMEYGNGGKPMKREGAYTWYPVQVSEEHAIRAIVDGEMTIPYPDGTQAKLRYERHVEGADGNWSWIGRVEGGDPGQEAILTFGEQAVFASIPQRNGQPPLELRSSDGRLWAVTADPDKLVIPDSAGDTRIPGPHPSEPIAASMQAEARHVTASAVAAAATQTAGNTIDVAIGYSSGFRAAHGSQSAAVTRLNFLIEVGNQTFRNSNVNGYLRLVHAVEVNYTDATSNESALLQLTGTDGTSAVTVPSSLAPLRSARDAYGADIAILVRKFSDPENEGCGIAWINGARLNPITPATDAVYGYAVVGDGSDTGSDGRTYYCSDETLIHESAHLMGSAHELANSPSPGAYPYSYGYVSTAYNFRTVMAYGQPGQKLYRTFSNPKIAYCGGYLCGAANQSDNALSLNQTLPKIMQFRASVIPFRRGLKNDFNGDGFSDLVWRHKVTNENSIWNSTSPQGAASSFAAANWHAVGYDDFNGDGRADILWRDLHSGANAIWWSGIAAGSFATVASAAWKVVGTGDFDGNGQADVLWRNQSTGENSIWWSGSPNAATLSRASSMWEVAATGDFNGDGKWDILWRAAKGSSNAIWYSGSPQGASASQAAAVWRVAGAGDFNGDGKFDILWHTDTGSNSIWWSGSPSGADNSNVKPAWSVAGIGDYNGDGKWDIFWHNSESAENVIWQSGDSRLSRSVSKVNDRNWFVIKF